MSCIGVVFEKQVVLRTKRLIHCPYGQMLTLDFLCIPFAWAMHFGVQMPGVGAPMISIKAGEPEGFQQRFESEKKPHLLPDMSRCKTRKNPLPSAECPAGRLKPNSGEVHRWNRSGSNI